MKYCFNLIRILLFAFSLFLESPLKAQLGCTDPQADNYDASAQQNDGSCTYPSTSLNADLQSELEPTISETSGLIRLSSGWWTHNDSGNLPELYQIDTTDFSIIRTVSITNASNIDWEEITVSQGFVYIGDFGNNLGTRQDLRVLKFDETLLEDPDTENIIVDFIEFSYPDQVDFTPKDTHSYDCEAFVSYEDSLHLFTKHRGNGYTKHYVIPKNQGTYSARFVDSLDVGGQVTASAIQGDSVIVLIGYTPPAYSPFMFLLWDFQNGDFFTGNKRSLSMGTVLDQGQQEAVAFFDDFEGYITSEAVSQINMQARIYKFSIGHLFSTVSLSEFDNNPIKKVFPNPSNGSFVVNIQHPEPTSKLIIVDDSGREVFTLEGVKETNHINFGESIKPGIYTIQLFKKSGIFYKKIAIH